MKHTDPSSYLRHSVSKRGKSSQDGVYLTHIVVTANADDVLCYESSTKSQTQAQSDYYASTPEWNQLLVNLRRDPNEMVHSMVHRGEHLLEFISEGNDLSLVVVIPYIQVRDFEKEVSYYASLLRLVSSFAGKLPTQIRFSIGVACISWEEMVESGDAQEIDVGY